MVLFEEVRHINWLLITDNRPKVFFTNRRAIKRNPINHPTLCEWFECVHDSVPRYFILRLPFPASDVFFQTVRPNCDDRKKGRKKKLPLLTVLVPTNQFASHWCVRVEFEKTASQLRRIIYVIIVANDE